MHDIKPVIPKLFNEPGVLLYIGARADAHSWLDELIAAGHTITILEVWADNAYNLSFNVHNIVIGDVRDIDHIIPEQSEWDYTFWWHGPEHLNEDEISLTIQKLESRTKKLIAMACPFGLYPQGPHKGNPYEEHKTTIYPEFFSDLGYSVKTDGNPDIAGSEIVGWKELL